MANLDCVVVSGRPSSRFRRARDRLYLRYPTGVLERYQLASTDHRHYCIHHIALRLSADTF